jgi:hypothetical protein
MYAHFQMRDNLIASGDFIEDGERRPATEAEIQEINEQLADTLSVSPVNGQF